MELSDFGCFLIMSCGVILLQRTGMVILCSHDCVISFLFALIWFNVILLLFVPPLKLAASDISLIYHMIRGQGTIKLYVVYNVLEVSTIVIYNSGLSRISSSLYCQFQSR